MKAKKHKGRSVPSQPAKFSKTALQEQSAVNQQSQAKTAGRRFSRTDLGNARRLVALHGSDLRHCAPWRSWLVWSGKRWAVDRTDEIYRRAKSTVDSIKAEAKSTGEEDDRDALHRHCSRSQSVARIEAMCRLAQSEKQVVVTPEEWDRNPFLLNCKNGTLDLRTGVLRQFSRADLITKLTPVEFVPSAMCPVFEGFLQRITGGDAALAAYLQRCIGYCLTGQVTEKALFFLWGEGDNGKTTLIEAIRHILGEYAGQVPIESFLRKTNSGIPNDLAQLDKLRFVTSSEIPEGRSLDEAKVKYMTGMGMIQARYLHHEFFEFQPWFKLFIDTNRMPRVAGDEKAVWNRIRVIPLNVSIPDTEKDKKLLEKLKAEAAGILAWAVRGCVEWQANGLQEPEAVRKASQAYREESDTISRFVEDRCEIGNGFEAKTVDLYEAYAQWCSEEGEQLEAKPVFGKLLRRRDLRQSKVDGDRAWTGIRLKSVECPIRHALRGV